jgi:arylformamidase
VIVEFKNQGKSLSVDFKRPMDISIPMKAGNDTVNAWYVDDLRIEPVRNEHFLGSVAEGGHVNFRDIYFNPHGHGTHTECVGHICDEVYSVNNAFKTHFFIAELITIEPESWGDEEEWRAVGDKIIVSNQLEEVLKKKPEALIIRTAPNSSNKRRLKYSNTNPPYLCHSAAETIRLAGIKHLLIDLPSVDREKDGGKMLAHKAFWNYPESPVLDTTITELIFVPDNIKDGSYLLELQVSSFENDAAPSRPVLYELN